MVLLKFKSELPPPVVLPSAELSQLIKTNLHYPETYTHPFVQDRWDTHTHTTPTLSGVQRLENMICMIRLDMRVMGKLTEK